MAHDLPGAGAAPGAPVPQPARHRGPVLRQRLHRRRLPTHAGDAPVQQTAAPARRGAELSGGEHPLRTAVRR